MAYKCSFLDSEIYIAQDVNDIFARITSGGVVFTDTGYTFGDLNEAQSNTVSGGVTRDINSCLVIKSGDTYKISKGACFMNDGSAITFDEDGQEIQIIPGVVNYVYLMRNIVQNAIEIVVSQEIWDEDSIPLAEINENGIVYDRRKYAKAKVDLATCGKIKNFTVEFKGITSTTSETVTVDLEDGAFSYVILWGGKRMYHGIENNRVSTWNNLLTLADDGEEAFMTIGPYEGGQNEDVYFRKDGQKLHIYLTKTVYGEEFTFNMGVI